MKLSMPAHAAASRAGPDDWYPLPTSTSPVLPNLKCGTSVRCPSSAPLRPCVAHPFCSPVVGYLRWIGLQGIVFFFGGETIQ